MRSSGVAVPIRPGLEATLNTIDEADVAGFSALAHLDLDTIAPQAVQVTMYQDQGQIAIELMGFERGVTVAGGLPIPVTTPAHGTAFDIAGQGIANVGAPRQAFDLLLRMAKPRRAERGTT